ncbi:MAG: tRNA (adenosine(37)-N6)-threonylcarbamoyltransferase complex dimerization subunit type 1 TsaB [Anaerolineales bacterium]|nr:tRNA (adenosine(37)-N6)-threonylcarbamoyltransferase complex dimerization subunit type 1 TsaB [Anaerolineales bacterium]
MTLLAIDTATRWTGLALHDGTAVLVEQGWRAQYTQSVELSPAIATILQRAGLEPADLKGIAIALGPGSYTGLRIGLGVAKGLALAHHMPLIGVPTLDITAASVDRGRVRGQLLAVAEAGRRRITVAPYEWQKRLWVATAEPYNTTWETLLPTLEQPTTLAGEISADAARLVRQAGRHLHLVNPASSVRRPACLAELGWYRLRHKMIDDPRTLTPIYLRDPDGS